MNALHRSGIKAISHILYIPLLALLSSCGAGPQYSANPSLGPPTFTNLSNVLLRPTCLRCHNSAGPSGGVSVGSYEELASSTIAITPFQPHQSEMYNEFVGQMLHESAVRLSIAELELIYQWIALGAKND